MTRTLQVLDDLMAKGELDATGYRERALVIAAEKVAARQPTQASQAVIQTATPPRPDVEGQRRPIRHLPIVANGGRR